MKKSMPKNCAKVGCLQLLLQVQKCYEISGIYSKINDDGEQEGAGDFRKLEQLGELLNALDAGDSILVARDRKSVV